MKAWLVGITGMASALGAAGAQQSAFGLGIVLGNPSGISAKVASGANSLNLILGYDLDDGPGNGPECCDDGSLYLGGDYVWYNYRLIRPASGRMPLYYGPGLNATIWDGGSRVGARIAVGLEYQFASAPFDIFLEIAPGINVIPDTEGYVSAGLGSRFFF